MVFTETICKGKLYKTWSGFGVQIFINFKTWFSYDNQFELFHEELKEWSPEVMDLPKYLKDNGLTDDIFAQGSNSTLHFNII